MPTIDSGAVTAHPPNTDNITYLPSEPPEQNPDYPLWEYEERKDPKWGEVTRRGLIIGRGKTQRVVPPDDVYKLATRGCPDREIAEWFGVNEDTLRYNFKSYLTKARAHLKQRLRQAQIRTAIEGNPTLLIWLGKNMLGQSDTPINTDDVKPLPWTDD